MRVLHKLQFARDLHADKLDVATAATRVATAQAAYDLDAQDKGQRAAWVAERRELLSRRRLKRLATEKRTLKLEVRGDCHDAQAGGGSHPRRGAGGCSPVRGGGKQEVARIRGAARAGARQSETAVEIAKSKAAAVTAKVLRVTEAGRPWALMREQAAQAGRAEVELETAIRLPSSRSSRRSSQRATVARPMSMSS